MKFECAVCGEHTEDISPLGPEGVVICEGCASTAEANRFLDVVRNATLAAIALGVDPEKRIAISNSAKAERDIDWFDAIQNTVGKRPRSRLEAMEFIRQATTLIR